jgi:Uma2 family endonuclease
VEEFDRIPNRPGGVYELRHGEAVFVTFPVREHKDLQRRLRKLLEQMAGGGYLVDTEFPYRPLPQHELWDADVACVAQARYQHVAKWLEGSPELIVEVQSPSNTKAEIHDKAMTTLAGAGAMEFWAVDPKTGTVTVYTKTSGMHVHGAGMAVPVPMFAASIPVNDLFAS